MRRGSQGSPRGSVPSHFPHHQAAQGSSMPPLDLSAPQAQYPLTYGGPMPPVQRGARFLTLFVNFFARSLALVAVIVLLELALPPEYKPTKMIGGFLGNIDAAEMEAKMASHAEYERQLAEAKASVEQELILARAEAEIMANAYNAMYERTNKALELALQMEASHLQAKEDVARAGMTGRAINSIGNDILCMMGEQQGCRDAERIRDEMITEFDRLTTSNVGRIRDQLMGDVPPPSEFRNVVRQLAESELKRLGY